METFIGDKDLEFLKIMAVEIAWKFLLAYA
jgi:hypothetical protein